jgi:ubiquinone/menaquinone biosynthesis C-methylase UbiE
MSATSAPQAPVNQHKPGGRTYEILTAVSMTMGRGPGARAVAPPADETTADQVVDIGCGPGTAVREAARRGARATGIDPSADMLRLARWISSIRGSRNVTWLQGRAEVLPVRDGSATLAWALSSVHHWDNRAAALREIDRALAPAGRVLLAERLTKPGAHGHASHGITRDQAEALAKELTAAGFADVHVLTRHTRHRTLITVEGTKRSASD